MHCKKKCQHTFCEYVMCGCDHMLWQVVVCVWARGLCKPPLASFPGLGQVQATKSWVGPENKVKPPLYLHTPLKTKNPDFRPVLIYHLFTTLFVPPLPLPPPPPPPPLPGLTLWLTSPLRRLSPLCLLHTTLTRGWRWRAHLDMPTEMEGKTAQLC